MSKPTYSDFVRVRTQANPCLSALCQHLKSKRRNKSRIVVVDYPQKQLYNSEPLPHIVAEEDLVVLLGATPPTTTRLLFIEDISPGLISSLGETLDIDPLFFSDYVNTSFEDIEKAPLPPSLAFLPSLLSTRDHAHLHQLVVDLGEADAFAGAPYGLKTCSNVPRNVHRLPSLSGRQLAIARTCRSVFVKTMKDSCVCENHSYAKQENWLILQGLFLFDRPVTSVMELSATGREKAYQAKPLHGGFEDFESPVSVSSFIRGSNSVPWAKGSMLNSIVHCFQTQPPPGFQASSPSVLALGFYPIRITLAEWNSYVHLISRYAKYYEYSLRNMASRRHDDDIIDLQRWRRRCKQSRHKLAMLAEVFNYRIRYEDNIEPWNLILRDINYLRERLRDYNKSLEQMVVVATSMVQLLDSRRSILETVNVRRLTYIALVFIPLAWVASLFSMSDGYLPGREQFWVYCATALPLLGLVLFLSALPWDSLGDMLERARG
ncbi:hypothetical protein ACJZ2D_008662 [Fusarium nematophilum]